MFLLLLAFVVLLVILKVRSNWNYWRKQGVVQVHGITMKYILQKRSLGEIHKEIYDAYPDEPAIGSFQGSIPAIIVKDIKNVQAVLAGDFPSFYKRGGIINHDDFLSNHLFNTDDYPTWKILRQNMTTIVTNLKLKSMFSNLDESARKFVDILDKAPDFSDNIFEYIYSFSTDSTGSALFGFDANAYNQDSVFLDTAHLALKPGYFGSLRFFISNVSPTVYKILNLEYAAKFKKFYSEFVDNLLKSRENDIRNDYTDIFVRLKKIKALNDGNITMNINITDEILASQFYFSFQAGGEVSTIAINFTLLELSNHKNILEKVHKEIDEVFDNCDDKLTYEDSVKLEYLEMVVNEGFRMYPSVGSIQRECTKDTTLPVGDIKVKKGDIAIVPILGIHMDEKIYPNPKKFIPERFLSHETKPAKFTYLPFGEGNRICVGERFARLQVKIGLAWILRRFTLEGTGYRPTTFDHQFITIRISHSPFKLIKRKLTK